MCSLFHKQKDLDGFDILVSGIAKSVSDMVDDNDLFGGLGYDNRCFHIQAMVTGCFAFMLAGNGGYVDGATRLAQSYVDYINAVKMPKKYKKALQELMGFAYSEIRKISIQLQEEHDNDLDLISRQQVIALITMITAAEPTSKEQIDTMEQYITKIFDLAIRACIHA